MLKALVTIEFTEEELQGLRDLGYEVIFKDEKDITFSDEIKDIDLLVCFNPFNKIDISQFPNLKWIQLITVGINQAPADKILEHNIILSNNRGGFSIPISEWIVLKILEMIKNSKEYYEKQRQKIWEMETSMSELYGKTVGFIGTGFIAQEAAKRLKGFEVQIHGTNTSGKQVDHFDQCFNIDDLNDVVSEWDFVVLTAPYTEKTHHLIDETVFDKMKDGVYLVNIARGSIIDEKALIHNLESGKIKKAALDVFEIEPLPTDNPLWEMDNVAISPHGCWGSEMDGKRKYDIVYNNMKRFINREGLINVINFKKGY